MPDLVKGELSDPMSFSLRKMHSLRAKVSAWGGIILECIAISEEREIRRKRQQRIFTTGLTPDDYSRYGASG